MLRSSVDSEMTINLDVLGKITKFKNNEVKFEYYVPSNIARTSSKSGMTTLRAVVEREGLKTQLGFNKTTLLMSK